MRMRLEPPVSDAASSRGSITQLPTPISPPFHSASIIPPAGYHRGSANSSLADIQDATSQLRGMIRSPTGQDAQHDFAAGPPKPPAGNPWDWQAKPGEARTASDAASQHRRDVDDESPVLPSSSMNGDGMSFSVVHPPPATVVGTPHTDHSGIEVDNRRMSAASGNSVASLHHPRPPPKQPTLSSFSIPENEVSSQPGAIPFFQPTNVPYSPGSQYSQQAMAPMSGSASHHSRQVSIPTSDYSDTSEAMRPDLISLASHDTRARSESLAISPLHAPSIAQPYPEVAFEQPSAAMLAEMDCAPIPVVTEEVTESAKPSAEQAEECKIDESSSFNLAKGFCDGAKEVIRGGIGVKRTKKPVAICHHTANNYRANVQIGVRYFINCRKMFGVLV